MSVVRILVVLAYLSLSTTVCMGQGFELLEAPTNGIVEESSDGKSFVYIGSPNKDDTFEIRTLGDDSTTFSVVVSELGIADVTPIGVANHGIDGVSMFLVNADLSLGDSGNFAGVLPSGGKAIVLQVAVGKPDPLGGRFTSLQEYDYPQPDQTGRCHDDIPEYVDPEWPLGTVEDAIDAIEESLRNRKEQIERLGEDGGHRNRIRIEEEWLRKLNNRHTALLKVGIGAGMIGVGGTMITAGVGGSAVLIADDLTVIGVADDPLLIITGGTIVAGGVVVGVGGIIDWLGW